jgi:hypothetical protein
VFDAGEFWCFNNEAVHEAFNPSNDWRIQLIFDLQPQGRPLHFQPSRSIDAEADGRALSYPSGASALSCQWRNSRWLSSVSSRKITMPVAEISARAANMRGILSW